MNVDSCFHVRGAVELIGFKPDENLSLSKLFDSPTSTWESPLLLCWWVPRYFRIYSTQYSRFWLKHCYDHGRLSAAIHCHRSVTFISLIYGPIILCRVTVSVQSRFFLFMRKEIPWIRSYPKAIIRFRLHNNRHGSRFNRSSEYQVKKSPESLRIILCWRNFKRNP